MIWGTSWRTERMRRLSRSSRLKLHRARSEKERQKMIFRHNLSFYLVRSFWRKWLRTFAWRLLRRALPTGMRAGRFSTHIDKQCSWREWGTPFFPLPICKSCLVQLSMALKIRSLFCKSWLNSCSYWGYLVFGHPNASTTNLYTFLWCLWKSRNDNPFVRKSNKPFQVHAAAKAILQGVRTDDELTPTEVHASITQNKQCTSLQQGSSASEPSKLAGPVFYVDAAWSPLQGQNSAPAGIGIFIQDTGLTHSSNIFISAMSPHVSSALQAEAFGVQLAVTIAELLCSEQPIFLTENKMLSVAAAANNPVVAADCTSTCSHF